MGDVILVVDYCGIFGFDYEWVFGGGWLMLILVDDNIFNLIYFWCQSDEILYCVISELWNEFLLSFDLDGCYFYFVVDCMF